MSDVKFVLFKNSAAFTTSMRMITSSASAPMLPAGIGASPMFRPWYINKLVEFVYRKLAWLGLCTVTLIRNAKSRVGVRVGRESEKVMF